ncbi:MAG: fructose bisphosphate aldolase [Corynebacterium sp.]|uniref:fructose bisphosphate aldolase n=1 Tax=Corynebacterium sp. TaxID=1720 RepID=UPI00264884D6|nr:fructose bisphosphate aldolase [Corynebacterium sp.]MDN5605916.1 fructose bisphosphate aldolase [Kocuria sp.]MDN5722480.1 fructose bisphosphate aldolase [Corynebacterium sp.]MDN6283100.1 fructose bisphosphate aldolase [Corynebacterium sp.]MDN6306249.1 fructose bisphosphate aldolase [Corynebacterium sp.]MDN6351938.1 fructose bisphosphate aldolase [Corynebacterium sp.]
MPDPQQLDRFTHGTGFVAALDQSGGSTPKALAAYGIDENTYSTDEEMFDLIHQARSRIITSPAFTSDRIIAAILFEGTLERQVNGTDTVDYLWNTCGIVPILKIDKGLQPEVDGVQLMKDIPGLDDTLSRARAQGVFGTKERSVIHSANPEGIAAVVGQQFALADQILAAGLVPILEPEISIDTPDKEEAEKILKAEILTGLESRQGENQQVAVKVTIPSQAGFYSDLIDHPGVARVLALSGGYGRDEANRLLSQNPGLIASFSRALLDGLTAGQSDIALTETLDSTIEGIYRASTT